MILHLYDWHLFMCVTEIFEWIFSSNISVVNLKIFQGVLAKRLSISRPDHVLAQEVGLEEFIDLWTVKSISTLFAEIKMKELFFYEMKKISPCNIRAYLVQQIPPVFIAVGLSVSTSYLLQSNHTQCSFGVLGFLVCAVSHSLLFGS